MSDTYYVVEYEAEGFGKRTAGPYEFRHEAERNRDDIQGFEGVHSVRIVEKTVVDAKGEETT